MIYHWFEIFENSFFLLLAWGIQYEKYPKILWITFWNRLEPFRPYYLDQSANIFFYRTFWNILPNLGSPKTQFQAISPTSHKKCIGAISFFNPHVSELSPCSVLNRNLLRGWRASIPLKPQGAAGLIWRVIANHAYIRIYCDKLDIYIGEIDIIPYRHSV